MPKTSDMNTICSQFSIKITLTIEWWLLMMPPLIIQQLSLDTLWKDILTYPKKLYWLPTRSKWLLFLIFTWQLLSIVSPIKLDTLWMEMINLLEEKCLKYLMLSIKAGNQQLLIQSLFSIGYSMILSRMDGQSPIMMNKNQKICIEMYPKKISHLRSFRIDLYMEIKERDLKDING